MKTTKQTERIIDYMRQFGSITSAQAFNDLGVARLASRFHDLKKAGYNIESETESRSNRYGEPVTYKRYWIGEA